MAYVNVAEWKTDQVCEWLKGLDNSVLPYVHSFTNNMVNGQQLLNLRPEDLDQLGVLKLGHQEIILEAVEYLRNFHYELDRENLQLLALHLSCRAHSLRNELSRHTDSKPVATQTLSDVASIVTAVKPLVRWLDRPPFSGQLEYNDKKSELLKFSLEMATCAQRDRFAEKPIEEIRTSCEQLGKLADYIIQDIADPMILQPASLDLATLKKRPGDDLGFYILPSFHGNHQIAEIKFGSAAHTCGKMEEGDEIVQVNYQTVVGWERKNVLELFTESPAEVLLTLKRRPRHTKVYGQIYIKPYRLPSNKKTPYATRWQHNLPSPRPELLTIPDFTMPLPRHVPKEPSPEPASIDIDTVSMLDTMASDSSDTDSEVEQPLSIRLYATKPRNLVQRRATITGASPTAKHGIDIEQFWKELKHEHSTTFQLRDKAASCAHGLDNVQSNNRPQTCLGIEQTKRKKRNDERNDDHRKVQFNDKTFDNNCVTNVENFEKNFIHNHRTTNSTTNPTNSTNSTTNPTNSTNSTTNSTNSTTTTTHRDKELSIITSNNKYSDITVPLEIREDSNVIGSFNEKDTSRGVDSAAGARKERGKFDKSHSTPAYDLTETKFTDIIVNRDKFTEIIVNRDKFTEIIAIPDKFTEIIAIPDKSNVIADNRASAVSSITENETDKRLSNENLDINVIDPANVTISDKDANTDKRDVDIMASAVAQRINCIENHIREKNREIFCDYSRTSDETSRFDEPRAAAGTSDETRSARLFIDDETRTNEPRTNERGSTREKNDTETTRPLIVTRIIREYGESGRESSEEKSESTSSYVEGNFSSSSSSSDADSSLKLFMKNETLESRDFCPETNDRNFTDKSHRTRAIGDENCCWEKSRHDDASRLSDRKTRYEKSELITCDRASQKSGDTARRRESTKKTEKTRPTPPEPPPRKYFSKPSPLNLGTLVDSPNQRESRLTILRNDSRNDQRAIERSAELSSTFETLLSSHGRDFHVTGYRDFLDKSTDFIDEIVVPSTNEKTIVDHYGYTEISDGSSRDEKNTAEIYEPFHEKFGNGCVATIDHGHSEILPRGSDSPDGSGCSRQAQTIETKPKTLEKGVVNRAMMVARSMGLHGGSNKSSGSGSPRSNRKRNLLLAKRRNVSVKDVGPGDLEGWLTHRSRGAGGAWARSWFVLKSSSLYRFKTQDSAKSDCLIALPGFTASTAAEVKSRKYAFKVYHTGTVFYFAAETEDCLALWLDTINKATLGADSQNRTSGLFSETDESDGESPKCRAKGTPSSETKPCHETMFGSLKKIGRKDSNYNKEHEIVGASLDRKYLRFLGSRNQNVPVPTAQFRSYRRVLPTSTSNRKQDSTPNSPDLRVTVAGSTFYGLSASQSATDVPSTSQDMGDYRQTTDRSQSIRGRRSDDLRGFVTLEEFMLAHQSEDRRVATTNASANGSSSTRVVTPLTSDHVHVQHRNFDETGIVQGRSTYGDTALSNGMIYGHPRNGEESASMIDERARFSNDRRNETANGNGNPERSHVIGSRDACNEKKSLIVGSSACVRKNHEGAVYYPSKRSTDLSQWQNISNEMTSEQRNRAQRYGNRRDNEKTRSPDSLFVPTTTTTTTTTTRLQSRDDNHRHRHDYRCNNDTIHEDRQTRDTSFGDAISGMQSSTRRFVRDNGCAGSSGDLTCCASSSETLERARKEASVSRKGSFNLTDRRREKLSPDKRWMDSLRRNDKRPSGNSVDKTRLKNVAQYQPPPIPGSPFEQDGMRAAFEMHLDRGEQVQKTNRLKSLFAGKSPQKPNTLDLPKDSPKTLLGSPRLHRALFRDKSTSQQQQRQASRSASQSPGDSGISQSLSSYSGNSQSHTPSRSFSSVSSVSDWSPDASTPNSSKCIMGHAACQKRFSNANKSSMTPPTLPYIPPPTSPPPDDYPGLEYPPVFEPGTYSLTDPSLMRNRVNKTGANRDNRDNDDAE